jgi:hypothetical protein
VIVVVCSWRGIGATTSALLVADRFAAASDDGAWLIEADPAGGVLSGRLRLTPSEIGGLERVAFPTEPVSPVDAFRQVAQHRGSLHIVAAPADPFRAFACHSPRTPWVPALHDLGGVVVVDAGRIRAGAPTWQLLDMADVVLVVSSPEVSAAVASAEWVHARGRVSPADGGLSDATVRLLLVDGPGGIALSRATLHAELAEQFGGWLPWEPAAVDLVHRGASLDDRRLRRSPLAVAVTQLAAGLETAAGAKQRMLR